MRNCIFIIGLSGHGDAIWNLVLAPQLLARDWWMGGWKQRTCSTGMFSPSPDFRYLFRMAKISLLRTWNFRILSTIFFSGCGGVKRNVREV